MGSLSRLPTPQIWQFPDSLYEKPACHFPRMEERDFTRSWLAKVG